MNLKKTLGIVALFLLGFVTVVDAQNYGGRSSAGGDLVLIIIGVIIGVIVLFLICRELVCWYWKINRLVFLMENMAENIVKMNANIIDLYNNQIDVEYLLRILVRMEKCRMLEEGFIDGEKNKFTNWKINDDLKPHKIKTSDSNNIEDTDSEKDDEI